jgi:hypothetical protein
MIYNESVINWLLEDENPSVKYRTLVELLGKSKEEPELEAIKNKIINGKEVSRIFSKLDSNGLWSHTQNNFGSFTTTYYLMALSELGMDKKDERIAKIVEWYIPYLEENDNHLCAFDPLTLRTLVMLGFNTNERVKALINRYINRTRFDGGYLCIWKKNKYKGQSKLPKSCIQISGKTLLLFATLPDEYKSLDSCKKIVDYFLRRQVMYNTNDLNNIIINTKNYFPLIVPQISLYHYLYSLSVLGYGNFEELTNAWLLLETKKDSSGKFLLEKLQQRIFSLWARLDNLINGLLYMYILLINTGI